MNRKFILSIGLCLFSLSLLGQADSLRLSKNFQFEDGVYLEYTSFQKNQPDLLWDSLRVSLVVNPKTFLTQVEYIKQTQGDNVVTIDLETIWGFSVGGIPYIRLPDDAMKKDLTTFAGIQLRGKICYYAYENEKTVRISMPVYNPLTGRPFRRGDIMRSLPVKHERIMLYETGEVRDFDVPTFKAWIADDEPLLRSIEDLSNAEAREKLFKCLLIYVDRNTVFIK